MTMHELFDGSDHDLIEQRERVIAAAKEAGGFDVSDKEKEVGFEGFLCTEELERFYAIAYKAGMERAAEIAATTVCDKHIPTGVSIYGSRAARAIREEAKK